MSHDWLHICLPSQDRLHEWSLVSAHLGFAVRCIQANTMLNMPGSTASKTVVAPGHPSHRSSYAHRSRDLLEPHPL